MVWRCRDLKYDYGYGYSYGYGYAMDMDIMMKWSQKAHDKDGIDWSSVFGEIKKSIMAALEGLLIVEPSVYKDEQVLLFWIVSGKKFQDAGISAHFIQDNQSTSKLNVISSLHFSDGSFCWGKLVRVSERQSWMLLLISTWFKTFGQYYSIRLDSSEIKMSLWIPRVRSWPHSWRATIFSYKVDAPYGKSMKEESRFDDPEIGIDWKIDPIQLYPIR